MGTVITIEYADWVFWFWAFVSSAFISMAAFSFATWWYTQESEAACNGFGALALGISQVMLALVQSGVYPDSTEPLLMVRRALVFTSLMSYAMALDMMMARHNGTVAHIRRFYSWWRYFRKRKSIDAKF